MSTTVTLDNGDFNLVISALSEAAATAEGGSWDCEPGELLAVRDRLQAMLDGPAGARARENLLQLDSGVPMRGVYRAAYDMRDKRRS